MSLAVGSHITVESPAGVVRLLATVSAPGIAMCSHHYVSTDGVERRCGTPLQRTSQGDLADGVRAHYKQVHPERNVR